MCVCVLFLPSDIFWKRRGGGRMTEKKGTCIFVSTYYVPDIILGAEAIVVSKTESLLSLRSSYANRTETIF